MPTGYTAPIYEGKEITFEQFMLRCARNFGALVDMRDEPLDTPIPDEFEPSEFYENKIKIYEAKLAAYVRPTREELDAEYQTAYDKAKVEYDLKEIERESMRKRYADMLEKVKNWQPPTSDHENLKKFAISQLEDSIDYDCRYHEFSFPDKDSWIETEMKSDEYIIKYLNYYKEQYAEEVKKCQERTKWVRHLKGSLGLIYFEAID